jgi:3-phosphoshikimate 1-carboxyvinyltransferase
MDSFEIKPIKHTVDAIVEVPGSKSLTNRALLIAALCEGTTCLKNALFSDDSLYFARALQHLGFEIVPNQETKEIVVKGCDGRIPSRNAELFIGNAGTAARFLSAFLTLGEGQYVLDGDARMRERPIGDLVSSLSDLGATIKPIFSHREQNGMNICPPVRIDASGLPGGKTTIHGDISSQFLSALLMVSPYAKNAVEIIVSTELNSKPYVEMTLGVMSDFGMNISREGYEKFLIQPGHYHSTGTYIIEPDASAASYFFAVPAILGGRVKIVNISRNSKQGDIAFLDVLHRMGCSIRHNMDSLEVHGPGSTDKLQGVDVDMRDIPDTAQTLAVIAPFASTPTHIRGIESARVKESDRVSVTCIELARLGVRVEEQKDGMIIHPCESFQPASIKTYNDHRMAMSFGLMGLRIPGIQIENPGCVSKTFPNYFEVLESLR